MLGVMQFKNQKRQTDVNWDYFTQSIKELIPKSMALKMNLFLRAVAGSDLTDQQFENYHFTRDDIIQLCRSALNMLGKRDEFFEELSLNFAKFIYHTIKCKWSDTRPISVVQMQDSFKKANSNDKKILQLVYGSVGILQVEGKSHVLFDFLEN